MKEVITTTTVTTTITTTTEIVVPKESQRSTKKPRKVRGSSASTTSKKSSNSDSGIFVPNQYKLNILDANRCKKAVLATFHKNLINNKDNDYNDGAMASRSHINNNLDASFGECLNKIARFEKFDNCNKTELSDRLTKSITDTANIIDLAKQIGITKTEYLKQFRVAVGKRTNPNEPIVVSGKKVYLFKDVNGKRIPVDIPIVNLDSIFG